jgi:hypothetical protein
MTCATGRDLEAQSPIRRRVGQMLGVLLPTSMVGILAWGFLNPDDDPVLGAATSPHQVSYQYIGTFYSLALTRAKALSPMMVNICM